MFNRWYLLELDFDIPDYQHWLKTLLFEHPSWIDRSLPAGVISDRNMEPRRIYGGQIITNQDKDLQMKRLDGGGMLRELLMKMALLTTNVMGDLAKKHKKASVIQRFRIIIPVLDKQDLIVDNDLENDIENMKALGVSRSQSNHSPVHIKKEKITRQIIYACPDHNTSLQALPYVKFQKSKSKPLQLETFPVIKTENSEPSSEKHK